MKTKILILSVLALIGTMAYAGTLSVGVGGEVTETYSEEEYQAGLKKRIQAVENAQYRVDKLTAELAQATDRLATAQADLAEWEAVK